MCSLKPVCPSEQQDIPPFKRHVYVRGLTIHSQATGYIQSNRATMLVLNPRLLIANLKRMPSSL
jgi:hypothetical protein